MTPPRARYEFGDFVLDVGQRRLLRRDTQEAIPLTGKVFDTLAYLVEHAGEPLDKDLMLSAIWPGVVVEENSLTQNVSTLRQALGEARGENRYIATLSRRGYRFVAPVTRCDESAPSNAERMSSLSPPVEPAPRRWPRWAVAALLLMMGSGALVWWAQKPKVTAPLSASQPSTQAAVKSIAVLPFLDLSQEQDQQYFSEGLSEELINLLAQTGQLRVIARTSSFSFKGANVDIATVARKLNVTHVLEGSVRRSGDRVRITAQLIDAATSSHLWSQTYDRGLSDALGVQSDIATSVAKALRVALEDDNRPRAPRNAQAYEHLLRAQYFFQRRAPGDVERAGQYYRQALDVEPDFARAWAGLAGVFWIQTLEGAIARDIGLERVRDAAERALALDPDLAEAHLRLANYLWSMDETSASDDHYLRASALEPNNPLVLSFAAGDAAVDGRFAEAIELQQRAVARDPLSVLMRGNLAHLLFLAGQFDQAKAESLKVLEQNPAHAPDIVGFVLILSRQFDQALPLIQAWPESEGRSQCLALVFHALGRKPEADAALAALIESSRTSDPFRIAEVYAYRGETDHAFDWLQTATEKYRDETWLRATRHLWVMRFSPFLQPLHTDARWAARVAATQ